MTLSTEGDLFVHYAFVLPADDSGEVNKAAMLRMSLYLKVFYVLLAPMEIISTP